MEIFEKAVKVFGEESQIRMCIEEMAELTKELCKLSRCKSEEEVKDCEQRIRYELADVSNMIYQMEEIFGDFSAEEGEKIARLERLVAEKEVQSSGQGNTQGNTGG